MTTSSYPYETSRFTKRSNSGFRRRNSFRQSAQATFNEVTGPVVEIGGPTPDGYVGTQEAKIPSGLIVSNIVTKEGVQLLADTRSLPFRDKSLGGILMKGLTRVPEEEAGFRSILASLNGKWDDEEYARELLQHGEEGDYTFWNDPRLLKDGQRISMLREARRTLEPDGFLLADHLLGGELQLAEQLGFSLVASTVKKPTEVINGDNFGEVLLRLTDLATPAGQTVEQNSVIGWHPPTPL